jgi:hypothetical protein
MLSPKSEELLMKVLKFKGLNKAKNLLKTRKLRKREK